MLAQLLAGLLTAGAADVVTLSPVDAPRGSNSQPHVSVFLSLHDPTGIDGTGFEPSYYSPTGATRVLTTEIGFKDGTVQQDDQTIAVFDLPDRPYGEAVWFRVRSPWSRTAIGFSRVEDISAIETPRTFANVYWIVPVRPNSPLVPPSHTHAFPYSFLDMFCQVSELGGEFEPSYLVQQFPSSYLLEVAPQIGIEYLPGSPLHPMTQFHRFREGTFLTNASRQLATVWGPYDPDRLEYAFVAADPAPQGPALVTLSFDGETSDSIRIPVAAGVSHRSGYLLGLGADHPSGMSPRQITPSLYVLHDDEWFIVEFALQQALLEGAQIYRHLQLAAGLVDDGVIDAADFVASRGSLRATSD